MLKCKTTMPRNKQCCDESSLLCRIHVALQPAVSLKLYGRLLYKSYVEFSLTMFCAAVKFLYHLRKKKGYTTFVTIKFNPTYPKDSVCLTMFMNGNTVERFFFLQFIVISCSCCKLPLNFLFRKQAKGDNA